MNMYVLQRDREERWIVVLLYTLFCCLFQSEQKAVAHTSKRERGRKRMQKRRWGGSSVLCSIAHHILHISFLLYTFSSTPCGTCCVLFFFISSSFISCIPAGRELMWWNQMETSDGSRGKDVRIFRKRNDQERKINGSPPFTTNLLQCHCLLMAFSN